MSEFMNFLLISIFLSFPEAILIISLGFSLCNIKANIKKVLLIATIQSVVALLVRYADLDFGIHTIVQVGTTVILVAIIINIKVYKAVVPVLIGILTEGILSFIVTTGAKTIYGVDFSLFNVEFVPTLIYWLPVKIIELLLVMGIRKTNFTLCDIGEEVEIFGK